MHAVSYYAARAARDPAWPREQIDGARERARARREADPEGFRARRRAATRRTRERHAAAGLTFEELAQRAGALPGSLEREWLVYVLRDELRRGTIEYHSTSRRYTLNGRLPEDVKQALRELAV
jgi:hypothetical protein